MPAIKSKLDTRSAEFRANAERMKALVADLRDKVGRVAQGGDAAARTKHSARGKMLARERVRTLLDPGTPFLEIGQLAAWDMYGGDVHSASIVTGIPGRMRASWLSLKFASTHSPCVGTSEISWVPTAA